MFMLDIDKSIEEYSERISKALIEHLPVANDGQKSVVMAMKYSLTNGGKRLRPILVLEFCKMCGGDTEKAMAYACAVEYVHTYSLIHDDLPCMDNDDLRRGKPSCHKMYGEATALLAGDALLTHAFEIASTADFDGAKNADAVSLLAQNSGVCGMIGGQVLDLKYEAASPSMSQLLTVHKLKTGAMISAACLLGCIAGDATEEQILAASKFAYYLGIAFQIKDDILDVTGDEQKLGKPVGSDKDNEKTTYVDIVGLNKAQEDVEKLTQAAIESLSAFENNEFVSSLAEYLTRREK
ncbi:MAG: farnesyl diphosphate synthase [Eubacterium sp.]|nr:polyprenyl synthetase family protein [Oscillospiraceae bacterium]MDD6356429.1 polyprenyl synthetase family protein [Oscillospiraceae bacterium]MDY4607887.1 farnesyl diphosphate synthase [Eubacterium sp.]